MGTIQAKTWAPRFELAGLPRRDRKGCRYDVYFPDRLEGRTFAFGAEAAADISDAELAIARLNESARALANTEALARLLLRAESVASSRIEGLQVSADRLLRADVEHQLGEEATDVTAAEVLSNIEAMRAALDDVAPGAPITVDILLRAHERLLQGTALSEHAGKLRDQQNWIGGNAYNPCNADFVPPPPEAVPDLLEDLCAFCNSDMTSAIAQAAIAHAQFETIHPFVDGNGRVGRILIHLILKRRGLATNISPPISLILATIAQDYVRGLMATRFVGEPDSIAVVEGMNIWLGIFASASQRAATSADDFEKQITAMKHTWRDRIGDVRRNSAIDLLIDQLPGVPIATVGTLALLTGRSFQAINEAMERLVTADIVRPMNIGAKRNRVFEAVDVVRAFNDLERSLASPTGDARVEPPARPVPKRTRKRN